MRNLNGKSRVTEVDAVCKRMIGAFKTTDLSSDSYLSNRFAELEEISIRFTAAINPSKALSTLEEKDDIRDEKIRDLFQLVRGAERHPQVEIKAAAETLNGLFKKYGLSMTDESYATESSLIVSLMNDLSQPEMQAAIPQVSGVPETIVSIESAQRDFESARIAYEQAKGAEGQRISATKIKVEALDLINDKILVHLRGKILSEEAQYGDFARTISKTIATNNEVVNARTKKSGPSKD